MALDCADDVSEGSGSGGDWVSFQRDSRADFERRKEVKLQKVLDAEL